MIISPSMISVKAGSAAIGANFPVRAWPLRLRTRMPRLSMTIWGARAVILDLMKPVAPLGRLVDQRGQLGRDEGEPDRLTVTHEQELRTRTWFLPSGKIDLL